MGLIDLIPGGRLVQGIVVAAVLAAVIGSITWAVHSYNEGLREDGRVEVQAKWDAERVALKQELQAQRDRNLELQRAAERKYSVVAEVRDRFITKTITEVRNATTSLAACPVGPDAVRLLNNASRCASEDRAASCGAGDGVRPPG